MRMEIVVDTIEQLNLMDEWLSKQSFPGEMQIDIYVMEESKTYFYGTKLVDSKWILTVGESI